MPAASEYGSLPLIEVGPCMPLGRRDAADADHLRAADGARAGRRELGSVVEVAAGIESLPDSSIGARIGGAISTEAAIAACQSEVGASATARGCVPGAADGYTASATPAASATGIGAGHPGRVLGRQSTGSRAAARPAGMPRGRRR